MIAGVESGLSSFLLSVLEASALAEGEAEGVEVMICVTTLTWPSALVLRDVILRQGQ